MVLDEPRAALRPAELEPPEPGPGEVLLEVAACGVCRTDLHIVDGELDRPKLPLVPGHQIVARVVEGGERFEPGDARGRAVARLDLTASAATAGRAGRTSATARSSPATTATAATRS